MGGSLIFLSLVHFSIFMQSFLVEKSLVLLN